MYNTTESCLKLEFSLYPSCQLSRSSAEARRSAEEAESVLR